MLVRSSVQSKRMPTFCGAHWTRPPVCSLTSQLASLGPDSHEPVVVGIHRGPVGVLRVALNLRARAARLRHAGDLVLRQVGELWTLPAVLLEVVWNVLEQDLRLV